MNDIRTPIIAARQYICAANNKAKSERGTVDRLITIEKRKGSPNPTKLNYYNVKLDQHNNRIAKLTIIYNLLGDI